MSTDPASDDRRGLALRYRPRRFDDLTGQRHVAAVLSRMIASGHTPRQLLLSGGSGLGKTTVARITAAALLCTTSLDERDGGDACGRCDACRDITAAVPTHPDVVEMDAASHGGKDQIKELAGRAALAPMRGGWKIYIIDEVHAITGAGAQAFLKLLEEPPDHVVFMLATTNPEKLSSGAGGNGTIRGRCLELEVLRPSTEEMIANLSRIAAAEQLAFDDDLGAAIVQATDPDLGVRGTVMTLEKLAPHLTDGRPSDDEVAALLGLAPASLLRELTSAVDRADRAAALTALDRLRAAASEPSIRRALVDWARQRLADAAAGGQPVDELARRLELLAVLGPTRQHLDVAVIKLARPDLDSQAPETVTAEAQQLLSDLVDQLARARTAVAVLSDRLRLAEQRADVPDADLPDEPPADDGPPRPPPPVDDRPSAAPPPHQTASAEVPAPDFAAAADPDQPPGRPAGRGEDTRPSTRSPVAQRLLDAAARHDRELAQLLGTCRLQFAGQRLRVSAPDRDTAARLRDDPDTFGLLVQVAHQTGYPRVEVQAG